MKNVQREHRFNLFARARSRRGVLKTRLRPFLESLEVRQTPAVFAVNTALDTVAVNLQNGKDVTGHISLRSAIMAADGSLPEPGGPIGAAGKPSGAGGGDCAVVFAFGDAARDAAGEALRAAGFPVFAIEPAPLAVAD